MIKPVEIVSINKIIPIYKDGQEANAIQVVNFAFENGDLCGYNVIAQKGLYEIGTKAVYVQPDFCLSDISIFNSFLAPFGDPKKTKLGKNNRIRAVKFNFNFENSTDPIYSFGILLPLSEVNEYIKVNYNPDELTEILGITKYEEPESGGSGLTKGGLPHFLYGTDENNINNMKSKVIKAIEEGQTFGITIKADGSSFTQYFRKNEETFYTGICSRSLEKQLEQSKVTEYKNEGNSYHRYINPETKERGWFCDATNVFLTDDEVKDFEAVELLVKDSWVDLSHSSGLFEKGMEYCKKYNIQLAFRGEIYGAGLKGSGNKLNPDANSKQGLMLFGVDSLESGFSVRQHYGNEHNLKKICDELGLQYTKPRVIKVDTYEQLADICETIFKEEKANGRVIEGVVIRTMLTNDISVKYMNAEYDSKK